MDHAWAVLTVGSIAAAVRMRFERESLAGFSPELAKLERRRKVLEVELQKLEALRAATPEALLRDVLISPALVHVELEGEPPLREKLALVHFMADVLAAAASEQ